MFGGAYAASNSSNAGKATASAKAKKGPKGPKGATGPAGPAGAQGPAGPAGAKGDAGANGSNGSAGPTGPTGAAGAKGATGATGATGFSGFTETLPSGKTETGTWSLSMSSTSTVSSFDSISFPIPVPVKEGESGPETEKTAWVFSSEQIARGEWGKLEPHKNPGEPQLVEGCKPGEAECLDTGCRGSVAEPVVPPGTLCVYTQYEERTGNAGGVDEVRASEPTTEHAYGPSGAILVGPYLSGTAGEPASVEAVGTWAVTAP